MYQGVFTIMHKAFDSLAIIERLLGDVSRVIRGEILKQYRSRELG
jgi:hypothetical protein